MNFLNQYNAQIADLCRRYSVERLFAFGSVLTDRFNDESDVDLIVAFDKQEVKDPFLHFFDFKYSLEDLFRKEVQPVRNAYLRKNIENSKVLIYER